MGTLFIKDQFFSSFSQLPTDKTELDTPVDYFVPHHPDKHEFEIRNTASYQLFRIDRNRAPNNDPMSCLHNALRTSLKLPHIRVPAATCLIGRKVEAFNALNQRFYLIQMLLRYPMHITRTPGSTKVHFQKTRIS